MNPAVFTNSKIVYRQKEFVYASFCFTGDEPANKFSIAER